MAATSSNTKTHSHTRSVSLPSTSDQQSIFNEFYDRFQTSKEITTSCSSSSSPLSICQSLNGLNDLYESITPLITLPTTQQSLARGGHKEQLNKLLDELIVLLDLCSTTKDVLSMSMDSAKQLQSSIRRKRGDQYELVSSVEEFLSHRRRVKKTVCKALSGLQKQRSSSIKEDLPSNINILKEMRSNTLTVFESLLTFILGSRSQFNENRWSYVSKMMGYKRVECDQTLEENKLKKVDDELHAFIGNKKSKSGSLEVNTIQMGLSALELNLLDLDEQVDCLYRHLIKTRVSILNILNF